MGMNSLFYATNLEMAKLLISNKADVNAKDCSGSPPIFNAESKEIAKLLIDNGVNMVRILKNSGAKK